ncbi:MAG TPA: GlsB/YeaQ/YmgE family stress response membrane protein [Jatrophihabitans sp.]|nr:GlsB/YeaQ/YmgE family stress response membrane protein [Jatrophihabitans sp.]
MLGLLITLIIVGLIAGAVARLLVPGKQDLSIPGTIVLGIVGSFIGGFLGYLLFGHNSSGGFFQPSGLFGSIVGAVIALLVYQRLGRRRSALR